MNEITKEAVDKGMNMLDVLAAKIGVTIEYLWPYMIKQQIVECAAPIVALILGTLSIGHGFKHVPNNKDEWREADKVNIIATVVVIIGALMSLWGGITTLSNLPQLINPEYSAIKDLIKIIRG